jgi:GABA(A) receptor-associated protein
MSGYKESMSFEMRLKESEKIRQKYPDKFPVIVQKNPISKNLNIPDIDKNKYLVQKDLTFGQLMYVIRKRIKLQPEVALFGFVNENMISTSKLLSEIYNSYKSNDGFLYVYYEGENVFGF